MSRRERREEEEREGRKKKSLGCIIFLIFLLLIIIGVIGIFGYYNYSLEAIDTSSEELISVEIESGTGTSGIATLLKENGLIKNELTFQIYCKLNEVNNLQAGNYELSKNMSVSDIVKKLQGGDVIETEISITFQEGKNMRNVAQTIADNTNLEYDDIMGVFESKTYAESLIDEYWFLTDEILDDDIYYPLEGYLFPDTYTFESVDVELDTIITTLLNQTDKVLSEYQLEIESQGYTVHQFLTLASVVENEAITTEDRQGVAEVFLNRIANNMALQSDVTTYYAFKIEIGSQDLTQEQLNTYNKYNTRGPDMEGLIPIGPISNISTSSIIATLSPTSTGALFFVADKNGTVYFSSTSEEHEQIIQDLKDQNLWYSYE